ncbi:hypothetical protein D3C71_1372800 [compost metagenome]
MLCSIQPITDGPTNPPSNPHELTNARPPASAAPLRREEGYMKMIDWTRKNIDAAIQKPSSAINGPLKAAMTRPDAMTRYPVTSNVRLRTGVLAKRGNVAAPSAAAIHGSAVSRPMVVSDRSP